MTLFSFGHVPKAPAADTVSLALRASTYESGGKGHITQSIDSFELSEPQGFPKINSQEA